MGGDARSAITCCKCEGGCERESHGEPLCDGCKRDGCVSAPMADVLQYAAAYADRLRRAAKASRNYVRQAGMSTGEGDWFDWVPKYLDDLADHLDPPVENGSESAGGA